jgi:hypothetical protein
VSAQHVLREALAVVRRDHAQTQLAVDQHGKKCQPCSPAAVAWTATGALIKVAPSNAPSPSPQHTWEAWEAYGLLTGEARAMGYPNVHSVDQAGRREVVRLFMRALNVEPERRRVRAGARTGAQPRGAA